MSSGEEIFAVAWRRGREEVLGAALLDVTASLAAAISLLERSPKTAAPSNKMFDQMLKDYRASLERARAYLSSEAPSISPAEGRAAALATDTPKSPSRDNAGGGG